ncbi:uncharacterized protein [Rutidosis leptorrhynchoides]|uniref:uncharacterized protein n=1 Tax=Rutidosis leptorrhynchoides TaxID=125765 RepID=UPI003A9955E4
MSDSGVSSDDESYIDMDVFHDGHFSLGWSSGSSMSVGKKSFHLCESTIFFLDWVHERLRKEIPSEYDLVLYFDEGAERFKFLYVEEQFDYVKNRAAQEGFKG